MFTFLEVFKHLSAGHKYFLVVGDLNAKSKFLNFQDTNNNGDVFEEIILQTNSIILNNKEHTHFQFKVLHEWEMHSDHVPICVTVNVAKNSD